MQVEIWSQRNLKQQLAAKVVQFPLESRTDTCPALAADLIRQYSVAGTLSINLSQIFNLDFILPRTGCISK